MSRATANASASSGGIGLVGLLTVAFVLAKVFGLEPVASWSWWWVLSPLWISFLLAITIMVVIVVIGLIVGATGKRR